jgi:hypothetical protein
MDRNNQQDMSECRPYVYMLEPLKYKVISHIDVTSSGNLYPSIGKHNRLCDWGCCDQLFNFYKRFLFCALHSFVWYSKCICNKDWGCFLFCCDQRWSNKDHMGSPKCICMILIFHTDRCIDRATYIVLHVLLMRIKLTCNLNHIVRSPFFHVTHAISMLQLLIDLRHLNLCKAKGENCIYVCWLASSWASYPTLGTWATVAAQVVTNLHCKVVIEQKIDQPDSCEKMFKLISSA